MQSNVASDRRASAPLSRPKPPGSRRASPRTDSNPTFASNPSNDQAGSPTTEASSAANNLLPSPAVNAQRRASAPFDTKHSYRVEEDLGLDLPSDLTAALTKSLNAVPRHPLSRDREGLSLSLGRSSGKAWQGGLDSDEGDVFQAPVHNLVNDEDSLSNNGNECSGDVTVTQHEGRESIDSERDLSDVSLDAEWVGDLSREELEKLLFESRQIIKERERDLGIAATIGKALLEKNISLRNRHDSILSRYSSMHSMDGILNNEDVSTPLPRYSPPHTDDNLSATASASPNADEATDHDNEQITPRADQFAISNSGYFQGMQPSTSAVRLARMKPFSNIVNQQRSQADAAPNSGDGFEQQSQGWSPARSSHYVKSTPVSPSPSTRLNASVGQALPLSETHRRLEFISLQNDELLDQIAQLQAESEKAKREGGRHQKKLIREIDGLRAELDAAEARNTELERKAEEHGSSQEQENTQSDRPKRKVWRRRGTLPWNNAKADEEDDRPAERIQAGDDHSSSVAAKAFAENDSTSDAALNEHYAESEHSSTISRIRPATETERLIVAQLMSKVRELEDINTALIRDAHERDGRIGRFMEDSERLRDMYDEVENEATGAMSASASLQDVASVYTKSPSPTARRRRAPGNRYLIEGRRTLRAAMRGDTSIAKGMRADSEDGSFSLSSSAHSSPTRMRSARPPLRPRILITPSTEDLQAQYEADKAAGWEELGKDGRRDHQGSLRLTTSALTLRESFQGSSEEDHDVSQNTLRHRSSEGNFSTMSSSRSLRDRQRTLGSELGSVFGDQDDTEWQQGQDSPPQQDASVEDRISRQVQLGRSLRNTPSQLSLHSMSETESDIADLHWSGSTSTLQSQIVSTEPAIAYDPLPSRHSALVKAQAQPLAPLSEDGLDDGNWYSRTAQDVLPQGSLKNDVETSHENYTLLEKLSTKLPLHWADDEDFGRPITERDARKLGLIERAPHSSLSRVNRGAKGMLAWIAPRTMQKMRKSNYSSEQRGGASSSGRQIESVEDVAKRIELERLLRARRVAALKDRVVSGQLSPDEAREKGAFDEQTEDDFVKYGGLASYSFESAVTQRAFAYRSVRRRQDSERSVIQDIDYDTPTQRGRYSSPPSPRRQRSNEKGSGYEDVHPRPTRALSTIRRADDATNKEEDNEGDSGAVSRAQRSKRNEGEYRPLTKRERYRPAVVHQKVHQFSNETITWAVAWATFSIVMVLAFVSAFARGPKRLLYGQHQQQLQ